MASSSPESSPASTRHSSLDPLKCTPLHNPRTQDVFQSIVKGRKSWKTLRDGQVVWPPELEAALIEGLENYQPDDSRETRLLGRFPMRNRFISDWIFEKTGKRRTAKQVGSRLQQLRDTCGGKRLLNLLSPNRRPCRTPSLSPEFQHKDGHLVYGPPSLRYESESCSDSTASSPTTPTEAHATLQSLLYRGVEPRIEETPDTIVYIDLLPFDAPIDANGSDIDPLKSSWTSSPSQVAEERSWIERGYKVVRASQQPRHIRDIDPTITLLSQSTTSAHSYFTVYTDEGIAFSEMSVLQPVEPRSTAETSHLYSTSLVPGFWSTIAQSSDASQYVIIQRVVQDPASSSASSSTIFSAMYKFNITQPSHTQDSYSAHNMMQIETQTQKQDFAFDNLLTMDSEGLSDLMAYQKGPNYFDVHSYMRSDWSAPSSTASVYSSPMDCNRQISGIMHNDQLMSPTSSFSSHY
ncbi:Conidiophore development regulator abaA [Psilocybe cubensis]|uniref:TEA domain-containing protein n=2 Tax=Psilocybe cubensis TaxID=181762 RepID=A0A8H7Y5F4_PSICU|nr:Conidiophore development regulator abaA [Psilocybe cubensis]KAH9485766.1 Conidiophore development regulator abaA [Psilocybe cubensis]